jgi:hypothetical protein
MSTLARKVEVSRGALWFGLLGGASAWTIHLVLANVIAEFGCVGRLGERFFLGISLVAWLELTLTVTTMLVSGAATVVAYRGHRHLRTSAEETAERHIAWAGLLTSGMFTLIILFESIPILYYLHSC